MTLWTLTVRSWLYFWRSNFATAFGVAVGVAVLTGALLVGDSVRHSLRELSVSRLGPFRYGLVTPHFFSPEALDGELLKASVPLIAIPRATVEATDSGSGRASHVSIYGIPESSGRLHELLGVANIAPQQIVINRPLADDLGVSVGDRVVVRLATSNMVPADSVLAQKEDRLRSLAQLTVTTIIPAAGLGRFTPYPTHQFPRVAYLALETVQDGLDQDGRINACMVYDSAEDHAPSLDALNAAVQPGLRDYGLTLQRIRRAADGTMLDATSPSPAAVDFWQITTDRMILEPIVDQALQRSLETQHLDGQAILTYLATSISVVERAGVAIGGRDSIPYSTIAALDSTDDRLGPLLDAQGHVLGKMPGDAIVLNAWAAEQLQVGPGDTLQVTFFDPETTHGAVDERSVPFTLAATVPFAEPSRPFRRERPPVYSSPPPRANDPWLTPIVPGVTDRDTISSWDPPFPFTYDRIKTPDDDYWENHRATPKAFVSLQVGRRLWGSRFGQTTCYRFTTPAETTHDALSKQLAADLLSTKAPLGFAFQDLRAEAIQASSGTTPFDVLFLLFSLFIIAAALILVALLFRLGIQQRAKHLGIWKSAGAATSRLAIIMLLEATITAVLGSLVGALAGIGYAWLIVLALRTWWLAAVSTPFITLHLQPLYLILGATIGGGVALLTVWLTIRSISTTQPIQLLNGDLGPAQSRAEGRTRPWTVLAALTGAVATSWWGLQLQGETQAAAFLGSGACFLLAALFALRWWMSRPPRTIQRFNLLDLTFAATRRDVTQTSLTVALTAWACFLLVAVSLFRLAPTERGIGGFDLMAETDQPLFTNLGEATSREKIGETLAEALSGTMVFGFRTVQGEEASCRNLYRARRPRVLGISDAFIDYFHTPRPTPFMWAGTSDSNPWQRLRDTDTPAIPVVLDQNTAMYAMQLYGGIGQRFQRDYGDGRVLEFEIVGLLTNSLLQGRMLIHEHQLTRHFPESAGNDFFLIDAAEDAWPTVSETLEKTFADEGMDVQPSRQVLADLLAVQNTYLTSFQSLGGLGLLLGTLGLAAVQWRNVIRRQGELGLLTAVGFPRHRLQRMVAWETLTLLGLGMLTGTLAAICAVLPHARQTGTSLPLETIGLLLGTVLLIGTLASLSAARSILSLPLLDALRGK